MKLLQKGTQITWTVDNLLKEGFIKVGSKTYEEYWKHTKTDDILTLSVVDEVVTNRTEDFNTLVNYVEQVSEQTGDYLISLLQRFGDEYYLKTSDICCDAALQLLINNDLVFKIKHVIHMDNTPDYGLTHLGYQVYEQISYNQKQSYCL